MQLPPVPFETGIIAGSVGLDLLTFLLPRPNDGRLTVEQCMVEGRRDEVVVPHYHPLMIRSPAVVALAIRFLESGSFAESD